MQNQLQLKKYRVPEEILEKLKPNSLSEVIERTLHKVKEVKKGQYFYKTGFESIDNSFGKGIPRGCVITLAARPKNFKSALANDLIRRVCHYNDAPFLVFYWSLEMSETSQGLRFIASKTRKSVRSFYDTKDEEIDLLIKNLKEQEDERIFIFESVDNVDVVLNYIKAAHAKGWTTINVLDHTRLIQTDPNDKTEEARINHFYRKCVEAKKKFDATFIILSQLNRDSEKEVSASNLFGSDAALQLSDAVFLLKKTSDISVTLSCGAHREGSMDDVKLIVDPQTYTFTESKL